MRRLLLEVCVESVEGARAAQAGGADRIELCSRLDLDGCTPGPDLLTSVVQAVRIPVVAMVRPQAGPFRASPALVRHMCDEVRSMRAAGCAGVVLGLLGEDGRVDRGSMQRLMEAAGDAPVTFHRAFDRTPDADEALATLRALGVRRILTAGLASDALSGAQRLAALVAATEAAPDSAVDSTAGAPAGPTILVGGGVRATNVGELRRRTRARAFHSSVWGRGAPSADAVRALRDALDAAEGREPTS